MIDKKEIEENMNDLSGYSDFQSKAFKYGVAWAESKLKEIAIEFGQFAYEHYEDSYLSFEELFELFLKKRNENK
jgi:hypothetical protein